MNVGLKKGELQLAVWDFIEKSKPSVMIFLYIGLTLLVVFNDTIPLPVRDLLDGFIGRLVAAAVVLFVTYEYGWVLGLFAALTVGLLLGTNYTVVKEAFGSGGESSVQLIPTSKKWFIEQVLHENPVAINEEKVNTSAIQDEGRGGPSSSSGVQNSSVSR
jgi:hypothetical protein